jgi:glycerol-3-phosphate cytidylyltransferase-like family protein
VEATHKLQATNMKIKQRLSVVDACRLVDRVIQDCPSPITVAFLKLHKISVVVCGFDVHPSEATRLYEVPFELGIVKFVQTQDISKDQKIEQMFKRRYACSEFIATRLPHTSIDNCNDLTQNRIERMLIRLERACSQVLQ